MTQQEKFPGMEESRDERPRKQDITSEMVRDIFDFWVSIHRTSSRGPRPVLSDRRRMKIKAAIASHGIETCRHAILGCSVSPWHQGRNPTNTKYDELELILRDAIKIEQFAQTWISHESGGGFLDED